MKSFLLKSAGIISLACGTALCSVSVAAKESIDVLVLYTDGAKNTRNGNDINARIASYIAYSNKAYENSGVDIELRLAGAEQLDAAYTYVDSPNLSSFRANQKVKELRVKYGADLVTLLNLRQNVSGGYICGIGYVPRGRGASDGSSGTLSSSASSLGYSLVGVDCGLNTFTHELGHNMSLGHSYAQQSNGGVFSWARGHGVSGSFSTVMAYPQAFRTRNQLQMFSNPALRACEGQACGIDKQNANGADAATNLNLLAKQISDFVPRVNDVDDGDDSGGGDNGGGDTGGGGDTDGGGQNPVQCTSPELPNNLIANGDFNTLGTWSSFFGASEIARKQVVGDCIENVMAVENRSQFYGGAYHDLSGVIASGKEYSISLDVSLEGRSRDNVRLVLILENANGKSFQYLPIMSATSSQYTRFEETFSVDAGASFNKIGLHIYGPQPGAAILVDNILLQEKASSLPPSTDPADQFVINEQFEGEVVGWRSYYGGQLSLSRTAADGDYSLLGRGRNYWYSGPGFDASSVLEAGISYQASVEVHVSGGQAQHSAQIWLYYVDDSGAHWQNVTRQNVAQQTWSTVEGDFVINPVGKISYSRVHVIGPARGVNLRVDNLRVLRN